MKRLWVTQERTPEENKETWEYIPATVYDNPALMNNDPAYVQRLEALDETTRKAMLYGDWDAFAGQYFSEWRLPKHTSAPTLIPDTWRRIICLDYGFSNPSAVLWIAVDHDNHAHVYRELYGTNMIYDEILVKIREMSEGESIDAMVVDPALQTRSSDSRRSFVDIAKGQ